MRFLRSTLIYSHRYLGIAISLLVVVWFGSGIVMMYAGGMPTLAPETRLDRIAEIDTSRIQLSLAEAAEKAGFDASAGWGGGRVVLLSIMERPAYRFGNEATVFADTGEMLGDVSADQAKIIAANFMKLPADKMRHVETLTQVDQWTLNQSRAMPLHKFAADDGLGTELYIPASTGEVSMLTTARARTLAYLGVIPHWLYFTPLRSYQPLWYDIMVWTSTLACVLAGLGMVLGFIKLRWTKPFRWSTAIPYAGWMRWHFITGMVFGITTLTFAFSGLLSMEPYEWTNAEGLQVERDVFTGGALDFAAFPKVEPAVWSRITEGRGIKEVDFTRIQDGAYYVVRPTPDPDIEAKRRERLHQPYNVSGRAEPDRFLVAADTMEVRHEPFSTESLVARLKAAMPDVPIVEQQILTDYDDYYYSRGNVTPLPVLRVKFDDPMQTWLYVDPSMSQPLALIHRLNRVERWLFNGLHSLDFSFLYASRPLWDIVMFTLLIGGLVSSFLGLYLGIGRMRRGTKRALAGLGGRGGERSPEPAE
jgi:hypothetical protein